MANWLHKINSLLLQSQMFSLLLMDLFISPEITEFIERKEQTPKTNFNYHSLLFITVIKMLIHNHEFNDR